MKKKNIFIAIIIIFIILLLGLGAFLILNKNSSLSDEEKLPYDTNLDIKNKDLYKENSDGTFTNTSKKVKEDHKVGDYTISNLTITTNKDNPSFSDIKATITNNGEEVEDLYIYLTFIYKDGSEYAELGTFVNKLGTLESTELNFYTEFRSVDAYDYKITTKVDHTGAAG